MATHEEELLTEWQITFVLHVVSPCFLRHAQCLERVNRKATTDSSTVSSREGENEKSFLKCFDLLSSFCCMLHTSSRGG